MYFVQLGPDQSKVGVITVLKMAFSAYLLYSCNNKRRENSKEVHETFTAKPDKCKVGLD